MGLEPSPTTPSSPSARFFPCRQCGAKLQYEPGTTHLKCPYCSAENEIAVSDAAAGERDFEAELSRLEGTHPAEKIDTVQCNGCRAVLTLAPNITSLSCPFCGTNIVNQGRATSLIQPDCVLPFMIRREQAEASYRKWIKSRWFAPSRLKSQSLLDAALKGIYLPAWTYDCDTNTPYTGERGDAYYVTRTVMVNGKPQIRRDRRIRWTPVAGDVFVRFDDVLVLASKTLPRDLTEKLEPWDLKTATPYKDDFLAGFTAECYQTDLKQGFGEAQVRMAPEIDAAIRADIGGDEQRISSRRPRYSRITFKHILLPVWVSAYRFNGKLFQFLINARTGEVQGQRPWSAIKIAAAVLAGVAVIAVMIWLFSR
jgi:LSD1 subclass zinc finger protein